MMGWQPPTRGGVAGRGSVPTSPPPKPPDGSVRRRVLAKLLRADPAESFVQLSPARDADGMVGLHVDAMVRLDAEEARFVSQLLADEG